MESASVGVTIMDSDTFAAWLREPLPTLAVPEYCDTQGCVSPVVATLTRDGHVTRACVEHVASLAD